MPKGVPNKRYTPEFKRMVVETMKKEHLSIYAAMQEFGINDHKIIGLACLLPKRCERNEVKGHRIASKLNLTEPRMVPARFLKALDGESAQLYIFIDNVKQTLAHQ